MASTHYLKIGDTFNDHKEIEETASTNQRDEPVFLEELRLLAKDPQNNPIKRKQVARQEQQRNEERQKKERQPVKTIPPRPDQAQIQSSQSTPETSKLPLKKIVTGRRRAEEVEETQRKEQFFRMAQLQDIPDGYATEMESHYAYTVAKRCHSCRKLYNEQSERACPVDNYIQSSKYSALFRKKLLQEPQKVGYPMKKPNSLADFRTFFSIPCEEDKIVRERLNHSEPAKVTKQSDDLVSSNNDETVATNISSKEKRRSFRQRHNDTSKYNCSDRCCRCNGPVYMAEKRMAAGKTYHKQCFSCFSCAKLLDSSHLMEKDTEIYCRACYVQQVSNN